MGFLATRLQRLRQNMREQPLSYRVLGVTLLWSLLVTTVAAAAQLWGSYRSDIAQIELRLSDVEQGYVPSLAASVWRVDSTQIALMLDGILTLPEISGVRLRVTDEAPLVRGDPDAAGALIQRTYPLVHRADRTFALGHLDVTVGGEGVARRLRERALGIVASQFFAIFLVSLFVFALFQYQVNRHLRAMAGYARGLDASRLGVPLVLDRRTRPNPHPDEIQQVADAINRMRERLLTDIEARAHVEAELAQHRDKLEELVSARTTELQVSLEQLKTAQQDLVQSAKLASLGELVAGVAHEVNTPLGVALTASSFLELKAGEMRRDVDAGTLTKSNLHDHIDAVAESSQLIQRNLERAAVLVRSFKQVSVDRTSDGRREFEVHAYAQSLIDSLHTLWRHRKVRVRLQAQPGLKLDSFPGALGQVLTNLIQNALVHAFGPDDAGAIEIRIEAGAPGWIVLCVEDDGAGIDPGHLPKIFEPFYTTKRGQGGTGLGLHIVYNLVTQKLGGRVDVTSTRGRGTSFRVLLPVRAPE